MQKLYFWKPEIILGALLRCFFYTLIKLPEKFEILTIDGKQMVLLLYYFTWFLTNANLQRNKYIILNIL